MKFSTTYAGYYVSILSINIHHVSLLSMMILVTYNNIRQRKMLYYDLLNNKDSVSCITEYYYDRCFFTKYMSKTIKN